MHSDYSFHISRPFPADAGTGISEHLVPAHLQKLDDDGGKKDDERQDGCDRKNLRIKHVSPHPAEEAPKRSLFAFTQCRGDRRHRDKVSG